MILFPTDLEDIDQLRGYYLTPPFDLDFETDVVIPPPGSEEDFPLYCADVEFALPAELDAHFPTC